MFDTIKDIWNESRGKILHESLTDTLVRLKNSDPRLLDEFHKNVYPIYINVKRKMYNMTDPGKVKFGKQLQEEARQRLDFDVGKAYALWVVGAWLESAHLPGQSAREVFNFLDNFLEEIAEKFHNTSDSASAEHKHASYNLDEDTLTTTYDSFEEWYEEFKHTAEIYNDQLEVDDKGSSFIDFLDHKPLKRAYRDGVNPGDLAQQFAENFDIKNYLPKKGDL